MVRRAFSFSLPHHASVKSFPPPRRRGGARTASSCWPASRWTAVSLRTAPKQLCRSWRDTWTRRRCTPSPTATPSAASTRPRSQLSSGSVGSGLNRLNKCFPENMNHDLQYLRLCLVSIRTRWREFSRSRARSRRCSRSDASA